MASKKTNQNVSKIIDINEYIKLLSRKKKKQKKSTNAKNNSFKI